MNLALHKRRLVIALSLTGVCFLAAVGALIGAIVTGADWLSWAALVAVVPGLAAQIWFIVGLVRERPQP
jgi:hypothetical protein